MNEEQVRQIIREELSFMVKNKKLVFPYPMQILDGNDITIGQTVGTRIGATGSKIGFFGATPVAKLGDIGQLTVSGAAEDPVARGQCNDLRAAFRTLGLMA